MNKIKLNPPETAPRDGSEFLAAVRHRGSEFFSLVLARFSQIDIDYIDGEFVKGPPFLIISCCTQSKDSCAACDNEWFDKKNGDYDTNLETMLGWIEIERFDV